MIVKKIVLDYLEKENTDYAVMITGDWGTGKTYYWNNFLSKDIEESTNYNTMYISLYGINSLTEIDKKIFMEAYNFIKEYPKFEEKKIKGKVANIVSAASSFFGKEGFIENFDPQNFTDLSNSVLCFDDLERCKISVEEVLGYINSFVEHENIKTIIISNEKELKEPAFYEGDRSKFDLALELLRKDKTEDLIEDFEQNLQLINSRYNYYNKIKEKLIGKTVEFSPGPEYYKSIITDFVDKKRFESNNYKNFIEENQDLILEILFNSNETDDTSNKNIRILKHSLEDYFKLFTFLDRYDNQKLHLSMLKYFLIIYFEYNLGNYTVEELAKIDSEEYQKQLLFGRQTMKKSKDKNEEKKDVRTIKLVRKYNFTDKNIYFESFRSIIKYVETGFLDRDELEEEINSKLSLKEDEEQYLNSFLSWWYLEDDEFNELEPEVRDKIKEGKYNFGVYRKVFLRYLFFIQEGIIDLSKEEVLEIFNEGAENAVKNFVFNRFEHKSVLRSNIDILDPDYKECYYKYNDFLKAIKENAEKEFLRQKMDDLVDDLINEPEIFLEKVHNNVDKYIGKPIIKYLDVDKVMRNFDDLPNYLITELNQIIHSRYKSSNISEYLNEELPKLKELRDFVSGYYDNHENNNISKLIIKHFINTLNESCSNLEN